VYVASSAAGTAPKKLVTSGSNAAFDPSGFLLFTRGGVLLRQRFDPRRLDVSGEPTRVAERVAWIEAAGKADFSVSNTGVLAFQTETGVSTQFAWFDRTNKMLETVGEPGSYRSLSLSPDGKRLVYQNVSDSNLWILDMTRKIASRFTTGPELKFAPVWSPDGETIFFRVILENGFSAFFEKSAGGAIEEKLFFRGIVNGPSQISSDGKWLLYFGNPEGNHDIFVLPMTGERKPQRIVQSPFADVEPQFSPDGRFVAYASNATGRLEVYVQPFPATGERWQISSTGGRQPLWREDGKELFFVSDDRKFYAVAITPGPTFDYASPRFLFEMRANVFNARNSYIPSPDGQRFLVNMTLDTIVPPIHVVRNWTAGLRD